MKDEFSTRGSTSLTENFTSSTQLVLSIDVAKYDEYMRDTGMDAAQKEEFLRAMFSIVMTFVELGFGVHPLQQVDGQEISGKGGENRDQSPKLADDGVRSKGNPTDRNPRYSSPSGSMGVE